MVWHPAAPYHGTRTHFKGLFKAFALLNFGVISYHLYIPPPLPEDVFFLTQPRNQLFLKDFFCVCAILCGR